MMTDNWRPDQREINVRPIFSTIAGFFWTEAKISGDGFNLINQSTIDELWQRSLRTVTLSLGIHQGSSPAKMNIESMISLSHEFQLFSEKMERLSLACAPLHDFLSQRSRALVTHLLKTGSAELRTILQANSAELLTVRNPDEFSDVLRFGLCDRAGSYPVDMSFVPGIPKALILIESLLEKWISFSPTNSDRLIGELYEGLITNVFVTLGAIGQAASQVAPLGFLIGSGLALQTSLPYFDNWVQRASLSTYRPDNDRLKKNLQGQIDKMLSHTKTIFKEFIVEVISSLVVRQMETGQLPSPFAVEAVMYLETMSAILKPLFPPAYFLNLIEFLATTVSSAYADLIACVPRWTPELIWRAGQNWSYIENWSTLIALPAAKTHVTGMGRALQLLISNQLSTVTGDPQFVVKNRNSLPFDTLVVILQKYSGKEAKNAFVIPPALVKTLIGKFTPACKQPVAKVQ
jgi:hypothetical protein